MLAWCAHVGEANIAGAPLFPAGLKMLVGSFKDLFGTEHGVRLQQWCRSRGWVLAWALGEVNLGGEPPSGHGGNKYTAAPIYHAAS